MYYDTSIPLHIYQTHEKYCPLYARSPLHRKPDSRIDIYKDEKYHGTIILEFKYSHPNNVWSAYRETRCSEQLLHYGYQLASTYLANPYNLPKKMLDKINPISKVIAITPMLTNDEQLKEDCETNIVQVGLKPTKQNPLLEKYLQNCLEEL